MQPYLSPTRYLNGGYGLDVTSFSRAQIMRALSRSTATVNAWCATPQVPAAYDFRGGSVSGEQHEWSLGPTYPLQDASQRRVYLNSTPVKTITSFLVRLGKTYTITLNPSTDLYINQMAGYVEVVATAPTIVGSWPVGINFGLWNPVSETAYTYGRVYAVTDEPLEAESPLVYIASQGSWDSTASVTVKVGGTEINPTDYAVNHVDGTITFVSAAEPAADTEVLASYATSLPSQIEEACGIIATASLGQSRIYARGGFGLSSLKVAEVSLGFMAPSQLVTRNGVSIPADAATLLGGYVMGSVA